MRVYIKLFDVIMEENSYHFYNLAKIMPYKFSYIVLTLRYEMDELNESIGMWLKLGCPYLLKPKCLFDIGGKLFILLSILLTVCHPLSLIMFLTFSSTTNILTTKALELLILPAILVFAHTNSTNLTSTLKNVFFLAISYIIKAIVASIPQAESFFSPCVFQ